MPKRSASPSFGSEELDNNSTHASSNYADRSSSWVIKWDPRQRTADLAFAGCLPPNPQDPCNQGSLDVEDHFGGSTICTLAEALERVQPPPMSREEAVASVRKHNSRLQLTGVSVEEFGQRSLRNNATQFPTGYTDQRSVISISAEIGLPWSFVTWARMLARLTTLSRTVDSTIEAGDTIDPAPSVVESTEPCFNPVTGCFESPPKRSTRPRQVYTTLTKFYSDLRTELAKVEETLDTQRVNEIQGALGKWQRIITDTSALESYNPSVHAREGSLQPARLLMRAQTALDTCATQFLALLTLSKDGVETLKKPTTAQSRAFWAGDQSSGKWDQSVREAAARNAIIWSLKV